MRAVTAALAAFVVCCLGYPPLALSDDPGSSPGHGVAAPVPAAVAFPALAGGCFRVELGIDVLGRLKREHPGSAAFAIVGSPAQGFADVWRGMLGAPSVKVDVTLAWLAAGAAAVSEYGPNGCLLTATVIDAAQWDGILATLRKTRGT